jgi:hypothetical protein
MDPANHQRKRLPTNLIYFLMDCHERDLMKLPPVQASHRSAKSLVARGFLKRGEYTDGKSEPFTGAFITPEGITFLDELIKKFPP